MESTDARSLSAASQEDLRIRTVKAVRDGMSQTEAAKVFGVHRGTICRWCRLQETKGKKALKAKRQGRPPRSRLAGHEAATAVKLIQGKCPDQLKLPFALWTRQAVRELLEDRFGLLVSVWTVGRYLKHWGFTPQKPIRRAFEQNPKKVQQWLEETYPGIRKKARQEGAEIHWGDEMGLRSDHQAGRSYGKRGVTPVVPGTGQRFNCNMISTVTNLGKMAFMVFKERMTAVVFIRFLRRLLRHADGKIILIVDGHPVHRSKKVSAWISKRRDAIEVYFLPGYSPELNPDELLNQDVKSNALGRQRPRNRCEMISALRMYLRSTQKRPDVIKSYFRGKHVQYAAA